jgi:hypothetical protein
MAVERTIPLTGFDSEGDPEIRLQTDGTLYIVFNFMPPSDFEDPDELGPYADFDEQLAAAIGVPVYWEDREFFRVESPEPDTIDRLVAFISTYRTRSNPADREKFGSEGTCFERKCGAKHRFSVGQRIRHATFGDGEIINFDRHDDDARVRVRFADGEVEWLAVKYANLQTI